MSVSATLNRSNNSQFQSSRFGLSVFGLSVNHRATSSLDSRRSFDSTRTAQTLTQQHQEIHQVQHQSRPGVVDSITPSILNPHRNAQDRRLDRSVSHRITPRDKGKHKQRDETMNTAPRRHPVRVDQDGPWSVSVAESPHDARSYSIYIKTPTHNLTLTRTVMELLDLHQKLQDTIPTAKLPPLPLDPSSLPATAPPKRKSAFLNTLSRLASPSANKTGRRSSLARRSNNNSAAPSIIASGLPSPAQSPSVEASDPFQSFANSSDMLSASIPAPSAQATALASYLTTVSNMVGLRQTRVWRRFVRVRTDDLESVRAERAIKRVRSDLAGYTGIEKKDKKDDKGREEKENIIPKSSTTTKDTAENVHEGEKQASQEQTVSGSGDAAVKDGAEVKEVDVTFDADVEATELTKAVEPSTATTIATPSELASTSDIAVEPSTPRPSEDEPRTPSASQPSSLASSTSSVSAASSSASAPPRSGTQRSQSADPDKRISRAYLSSATSGSNRESGMSSTSQTETEDDSSTHHSQRRSHRKKRADSDAALTNGKGKKSSKKVVVTDFEMLRVLGKGCAGKVLLVRHKATDDLYAMKAITKRHVLAHQELQHTLTEQAVLKRMANGPGDGKERDPFVVKLWWSFHDKENLFLIMDFHPGGDLATQLARWGRLGRDRARFYAAEIVEGVEGLHAAGVIYRDLKPENILIGGDGHIVLTDFGLSKEFPRRTSATTAPSTPLGSRDHENTQPPWMKGANGSGVDLAIGNPAQTDMTSTFCGTAEYLAPEVIQGLPYSYEVDWWSFGTMLFEMLTGITPFWANNHSDMYVRVLQDELQFPDDRALDQDTKSLIRGLLQRNPALRICEPRIKRHPYFSMIDWSHVYYKRYIPPYIPPIDPQNQGDTQNFDDTFLDMEPVLDEYVDENSETDQDQGQNTDTDRTDGEESNTTPSQSRSSSLRPQPNQPVQEDDSVDVFDGYSFKGRHSVLIDGEEDSSEEEVTDGDEEGEEGIHANGDVLSGLENLQGLETEAPKPLSVEDELAEPKTPEARPVVLPPETGATSEPVTPAAPLEDVAQVSEKEEPATSAGVPPEPSTEVVEGRKEPPASVTAPTESAPTSIVTPTSAAAPATPEKDVKTKPAETKPAVPSKGLLPSKPSRNKPRKERSGIPALDRYLSDAGEDAEATERDDEDDDWDFVEMDDGEDRNGSKPTSLFARGVVDKYRLAVFSRKASTPHRSPLPRSASGMSKDSEMTPSESGDSPSPSVRKGRNTGLTFKKHPRQFLRPKSPGPPPSSFSTKSAKSLSYSTSATLSTGSSSGHLQASSTSSTLLVSPSLKSKESAMSMGAHSQSSDNSGNGDVADTNEEPEKLQKNKKLKKYKENAEKMFSIFSPSPRQPAS
uniref:Uncharacterized protein n=1 Tax=Moniliophthora roreri TaxID=221103 RepID=A0A0W0FXA5_MONRR